MKKTKLFKHFMTIINICALSVPLVFLCVTICRDVFPKLFTSISMQHSNAGSVFQDDIDYSYEMNQFKDINTQLMSTLNDLNYFDYIGTYDDYITSLEGDSYDDVIATCSTKLLIDFDVVGLFDNGIVNNNNNIAIYLFINFYANYLINISMICFLPEVLLCFFNWCRNLIYSFTDDRSKGVD